MSFFWSPIICLFKDNAFKIQAMDPDLQTIPFHIRGEKCAGISRLRFTELLDTDAMTVVSLLVQHSPLAKSQANDHFV
jgi:hypothetical protein